MKSNCLIIAGEKSGEEHCMSFFPKLRELSPHTSFWGVGGNLLKSQGMELLYHLKDFSSWGFSEVILKIPFYLKALKYIEEEVVKRNCQVAILIDFQDFNLKLAKKLKKYGVSVLYYVAPQAWAWKSWRAKVISEVVHTLFSIVPFEKKWFGDRGVKNIKSVTHPLLRTYSDKLNKLHVVENIYKLPEEINVLLLPGSRNFEVENLSSEFVKVIDYLRENHKIRFSIVKSENVKVSLYSELEKRVDNIYFSSDLHIALEKTNFAIAASGTVTLATALFGVPTIVCYKTSLFNEFIYKTFINYNGYFSLTNIVHEEMIFPELIQNDCDYFNILNKLLKWLTDEQEYGKIKRELMKTKGLVKGENFSISEYMNNVICESYAHE